MADTMQFDLVSPERRLLSAQAISVRIPGADGDMTAMPNHAPLITTLRPGILKVALADGPRDFLVTGGFAEIGFGGTSVLAEHAVAREDVTQDLITDLMAAANDAVAEAQPEVKDEAAKRVHDLAAAARELGLTA